MPHDSCGWIERSGTGCKSKVPLRPILTGKGFGVGEGEEETVEPRLQVAPFMPDVDREEDGDYGQKGG
jgi:hypothetical protein